MRNSAKKFSIAAFCLLLVAGGYLIGVYAQKRRMPASGFLQSTAAKIQLGVWDKTGVAKSDKAAFIVTAPNGKTFRAEKDEPLDDWVYATFPDDFSSYPEETDIYKTYKWKCIVDGKEVAGGVFKWGNGQADDDNRNLK